MEASVITKQERLLDAKKNKKAAEAVVQDFVRRHSTEDMATLNVLKGICMGRINRYTRLLGRRMGI
jgi:hypothetical protein